MPTASPRTAAILLFAAQVSVVTGRKQKPTPMSLQAPEPLIGTTTMLAAAAAAVAIVFILVLSKLRTTKLFTKKAPPPAGPKPQCSIIFNATDESLNAVWHMSDAAATTKDDERILATCTPTVKVANHKLTHNYGRMELVRGVSQPKTYQSGWLQFLNVAKKHQATVAHAADVPGRDVGLFAVTADSLVRRCLAGSTLELADAVAVAVAPAATAKTDFSMKYFDVAQFETLGNRLGVAESYEEGRSPGTRPAKSPDGKAPLTRRASTRTDMKVLVTPSAKEAM